MKNTKPIRVLKLEAGLHAGDSVIYVDGCNGLGLGPYPWPDVLHVHCLATGSKRKLRLTTTQIYHPTKSVSCTYRQITGRSPDVQLTVNGWLDD